jgi:hypothetical protein
MIYCVFIDDGKIILSKHRVRLFKIVHFLHQLGIIQMFGAFRNWLQILAILCVLGTRS